MRNKLTGNKDGNGNNLWTLYSEKKIVMDDSFYNYMTDKIFQVKILQKFQKTKLLKIQNKKILLNDGITIEKQSMDTMDKDTLRYFS